jgi:hypothetical protein
MDNITIKHLEDLKTSSSFFALRGVVIIVLWEITDDIYGGKFNDRTLIDEICTSDGIILSFGRFFLSASSDSSSGPAAAGRGAWVGCRGSGAATHDLMTMRSCQNTYT